MDGVSTSEAVILSKLESSDELTGIHHLCTVHLQPFVPFFKVPHAANKKSAKSSNSKPPKNGIRPLAKQFLSFIQKSLCLLPKRLSGSNRIPRDSALELFDVYRLCLDCLDVIAPELAGKPHSVQVQRIKLMLYLEHFGLYEEAAAEGFFLLRNFNAIFGGGAKSYLPKEEASLLPELNEDNVDAEAAALVLEVVGTLVKCVSKRKSKMDADYRTVISLVKESGPWFKIMDAENYKKLHHLLETYLHITTVFLVEEMKSFHVGLICDFSLLTFEEYKKSNAQDQIYKVALKICSSIYSQRDVMPCNTIFAVLKHVLDFMSAESKFGTEQATGFLDLVHYCANKFQSATVCLCNQVAEHLRKLAGDLLKDLTPFLKDPPFLSNILRLYGIGLLVGPLHYQVKGENTDTHSHSAARSVLQVLLNDKEQLQLIAASISLYKDHFSLDGREHNSHVKGFTLSYSYLEALKFLCQSLGESIYSNRNQIFCETESSLCWDELTCIHDAFHHVFHASFQSNSVTERERETYGDNQRLISTVVVAGLILAFRTKQNIKESTLLIETVISTDSAQVMRLKYLYVSLNNLAALLQRRKWLKEANKALNLSCKALWKYVVYLCKMHVHEAHISEDDSTSARAITDFVMEASEKTVCLLRLNQEGNCSINEIVAESLKCWSAAGNLVATVPNPVSLVKEWVKIQCMLSKDADKEAGTTLISLLSYSNGFSTSMLGKLLEEELLAYDENSYLNPHYSLRMKMRIINLLLEEVYFSKGMHLNKSRILIEKAKVLRANGLAKLDECTQCLSVAISILKPIYSAKRNCSSEVHCLLVQAYILHAIYSLEAAPNSLILSPKSEFLRDIHDALTLFISPNHSHVDEQRENSLYLWFQVIDLFSIRGYLAVHPQLYNVVIKLFNMNKISFARTLSELWKSKRLSHALCASPINHMFNNTFRKDQNQIFNSSGFWRTFLEELKPLIVGYHNTTSEIKKAASELVSNVPMNSCSIFLSSALYYDLSAKLISSGQMIEALTYAKEAHCLRGKLLQQKFEYSVEKLMETHDESRDDIEKNYFTIQTFKVKDLMATKTCCAFDGCNLTPWNVLSCYLESVFQVGLVQEILGNLAEAEMLLRWGRDVSQFHALLLFEIYFTSMLGKLYLKQRLWSMAKTKLSAAKKNLADNYDTISCKTCLCVIEIFINQQLGDLFCRSYSSSGDSPTENLCKAKSLYKLALDKLHLDWMTSYSASSETDVEQITLTQCSLSDCATNVPEMNDSGSNDKPCIQTERRGRRTKTDLKTAISRQVITDGNNRRITRSMHSSLVNSCELRPGNRQTRRSAGFTTKHLSAAAGCSYPSNVETNSSAADFQSGIKSIYKKLKCWHCVQNEVADCSSLNSFIYMNQELVHRKLYLRLHVSIGKYYGICGNFHEAHDILLQSISALGGRNSCCSKCSSDSIASSVELIGKHFPGDILAIERSAILYYICWFSLKNLPSQGTRNFCCELQRAVTPRIISFLKMAFILSREVPLLAQKISRFLAAIYVLATRLNHFPLSPSEEGSESRWASFFHQVSLGTHLNQQIFSSMMQKKQNRTAGISEKNQKVQQSGHNDLTSRRGFVTNGCDTLMQIKVYHFHHLVSPTQDVTCSLRIAPESCEDLEEYVLRYFQGLASTPIVCISLITGADGIMLSELLLSSPTVQTWILLSHLSSDSQHIILLPVNSTLQVPESSCSDSSPGSIVSMCTSSFKQWRCPWVSTSIDDIAPIFRHLLEENYYSSSKYFFEHVRENISLWWTHRGRLDECLNKFLQDVEDLWFGAWKYLLLGEWPDCNYVKSISRHLSQEENHLLQHIVTKKCYIGVKSDAVSPSSSDFQKIMHLLFEGMREISYNFHQVEYTRKPIILVLDSEVQMLPWENLPILRDQEVYRMPSVGSIHSILQRCCHNQEKPEISTTPFPWIDPLDSYYLLNPDGDLHRTQIEFEDWFKDRNMEGKIGTVPTIEELALALRDHDLFIYFGHGSGTQYIPGHEIQKLDNCAATLLLGCSSGSLYLKGCYMPQGAPISYLLAGSPVIVANLWEVTDRDIDRFGKAMLTAWMRERADTDTSTECSQCNEDANYSKPTKCIHRPRIGSFMSQARDACTLRFLIGAAPVCYGVPTGIIKRKA